MPVIQGAFDGNGDGNAAELWRHAMNNNEPYTLKIQSALNFSEL